MTGNNRTVSVETSDQTFRQAQEYGRPKELGPKEISTKLLASLSADFDSNDDPHSRAWHQRERSSTTIIFITSEFQLNSEFKAKFHVSSWSKLN